MNLDYHFFISVKMILCLKTMSVRGHSRALATLSCQGQGRELPGVCRAEGIDPWEGQVLTRASKGLSRPTATVMVVIVVSPENNPDGGKLPCQSFLVLSDGLHSLEKVYSFLCVTFSWSQPWDSGSRTILQSRLFRDWQSQIQIPFLYLFWFEIQVL